MSGEKKSPQYLKEAVCLRECLFGLVHSWRSLRSLQWWYVTEFGERPLVFTQWRVTAIWSGKHCLTTTPPAAAFCHCSPLECDVQSQGILCRYLHSCPLRCISFRQLYPRVQTELNAERRFLWGFVHRHSASPSAHCVHALFLGKWINDVYTLPCKSEFPLCMNEDVFTLPYNANVMHTFSYGGKGAQSLEWIFIRVGYVCILIACHYFYKIRIFHHVSML